MALTQQKFREIVFQLLFSHDFDGSEEQELADLLMETLLVTKKVMRQASERKQAILAHLEQIDALIVRFCKSYEFHRIARVEKNILRLGMYELCFEEEIPPKVVIAEAIRLARKFSTFEGANFVNAVLDAVFQERQGLTKDVHALCTTAISV